MAACPMQYTLRGDNRAVRYRENLCPAHDVDSVIKYRQVARTYSRWNNHIGCFFMASSQHWHSKDLMSGGKDLENVQDDDGTVACDIC